MPPFTPSRTGPGLGWHGHLAHSRSASAPRRAHHAITMSQCSFCCVQFLQPVGREGEFSVAVSATFWCRTRVMQYLSDRPTPRKERGHRLLRVIRQRKVSDD